MEFASNPAQFKVKVVPNSSRNQVVGMLGESLKVKLQAPPENGKANQALVKFLAKEFRVRQKTLRVESGQTSPNKVISIDGVLENELQGLIQALLTK